MLSIARSRTRTISDPVRRYAPGAVAAALAAALVAGSAIPAAMPQKAYAKGILSTPTENVAYYTGRAIEGAEFERGYAERLAAEAAEAEAAAAAAAAEAERIAAEIAAAAEAEGAELPWDGDAYAYYAPAGAPAAEYAAIARDGAYSSSDLRFNGVIYDAGTRYTWYSQRILPGYGLSIDGRHVSDEGYVVDSQDRVVVASSDLAKGTEVDIPFGSGKGIVADTGCASGTIDIYTDF